MSEREYLVCLAAHLPFGPVSLAMLYAKFGSWQAVFSATTGQLESIGFKPDIADKFQDWRNNFSAEEYFNILNREKINAITIADDEYPALLKQAHQPPFVLFYRGDLNIFTDHPTLGVVGSRNPSSYGQFCAKTLIKEPASAGIAIISGLAIGIDSLAHLSALEGGGLTAAVIGSGLDTASIYPSSNRSLAEKIIALGGAVISEFPPGTPGFKANFPRRNRVISGLSQAVLVIEAADKSGSLITARHALEQNREVLAVPGPINSRLSSGTNDLIRQGARPITSSADILEIFGYQQRPATENVDLSAEEKLIVNQLSDGPKTADELKLLLDLDIRVITTALSLLEIKGATIRFGGGRYGKV